MCRQPLFQAGVEQAAGVRTIPTRWNATADGDGVTPLSSALDFAGVPMLLDAALVVAHSARPAINTGIAHREPGVGQIGAGVSRAPLAPFEAAVLRLAAEL